MRAIESASYKVVEYLLEQGAKITQENIQGKTAFDLARDFADPRIYFAVKNKFDSLPKPKDGAKPKPKKKPEPKKKKKGEEDLPKKDTFLPPILMRRRSMSNAEALLAQGISDRDRVIFRPIHVWTEQDTTEQLLEKKREARERYGYEVDFDDFKLPFMRNVNKQVEKMGGIES